jgi:hypothetical protein
MRLERLSYLRNRVSRYAQVRSRNKIVWRITKQNAIESATYHFHQAYAPYLGLASCPFHLHYHPCQDQETRHRVRDDLRRHIAERCTSCAEAVDRVEGESEGPVDGRHLD